MSWRGWPRTAHSEGWLFDPQGSPTCLEPSAPGTESTASLLAARLLRRHARPSTALRAVTQAVSFIHENYSRTVKLEDMAAAVSRKKKTLGSSS